MLFETPAGDIFGLNFASARCFKNRVLSIGLFVPITGKWLKNDIPNLIVFILCLTLLWSLEFFISMQRFAQDDEFSAVYAHIRCIFICSQFYLVILFFVICAKNIHTDFIKSLIIIHISFIYINIIEQRLY